METTVENLSRTEQDELRDLERAYLIRLRDSVLEADTQVDRARHDVDAAVDALRWAVARRDDLARQLAEFIHEVAD